MKPHLVKELRDSEGNVVQTIEPEVKSFSVYAQTCKEVLSIMEYAVAEGGVGSARIPGYRIGGKTGTAEKPAEGGGYKGGGVYASFMGIAPIDDPQFVILLITDTPKGVIYGSAAAAPYGREIMRSLLTYLGIEPEYTEKELEEIKRSQAEVPDLTGKRMEDAIGVLAGKELNYIITPTVENYDNLIVSDQYPRAGATLNKGDTVTLYYEQGATEMQTHIEASETEE